MALIVNIVNVNIDQIFALRWKYIYNETPIFEEIVKIFLVNVVQRIDSQYFPPINVLANIGQDTADKNNTGLTSFC